MAKSIYQIQFPFYIRRSVYFIDRYFIPVKPGKLFRKLRDIKTKKQRERLDKNRCIQESDLKPFLRNHNFKETKEKYWLDIFFNNMLTYFTVGRICEAFQNLDRYKDLDYPDNFKLLSGRCDYLGTRPDGYELLQ